MIDHISLGASDLEGAAGIYEKMFAPLGLIRLVTRPDTIGFGKTYPEVWLNRRRDMVKLPDGHGAHLCLRARSKSEIDAFHDAAVAAGATSESAPAMRPHDRVKYYAAFVVDRDGNRIEAVTFPSV